MAEYSKIAKGHFTNPSDGAARAINLPFQPDRVEIINYTLAAAGAAASKIVTAKWDVSMGQGVALVEGYTSGSALVWDLVPTYGISTFSAGLSLQYGPLVLLGTTGGAGIAKTGATTLTVTTAAAHGLVPGNWVVFQNLYETSTTGMQQIAGIPFEVLTAPTTTTFTIGWVGNSSNLTAIDTAATASVALTLGFKQILYPVLYAPGWSVPWSISQTSGVVTVKTTAAHNFVVGQEIGFRLPTAWGGNQLNEYQNPLIPSAPQYFYVTSVDTTNNCSFTFNYSGALTAFTVNQTFASFPGLKFPIVFAAGDINSGGYPYTATSQLYPSPTVYGENILGTSTTINGPAIQGAFINNTSQGFIIGAGQGNVISAATGGLVGASGNVVYWVAYLSDYAVN